MASAEDVHSLCEVGAESVFGKIPDAELIAQLKGLALDPRSSKYQPSDFQALFNQTVRVRKAMAMAAVNSPQRKRKLELMLKDKSWSCFSDQQSKSKVSKGVVSSNSSPASFLLASGESKESFGRKTGLDSHCLYDHLTYEDDDMNRAIKCSVPSKIIISFGDSDDSANCQNPDNPENAISQVKIPSNSRSQGSQVTPTKKHIQPPRRSGRSLDFICDEPERSVIPVGPRFQADIPEWIGPEKAEDVVYKHETSKWINTKIWPFEGRKETVIRVPGKGRSDECSHCLNPGSVACVQRHIIEERLHLLCDLGGAFFRMKVDQHGEQIAKTWTEEEQRAFQSLAAKKPMHDDGKDFLKHAFKCLPNRCRKTIMNYYFNAYLPRRMGQMTRASKEIDTDDEAEEDVNCSGKKPQGETGGSGSKNSKNRFLRQ